MQRHAHGVRQYVSDGQADVPLASPRKSHRGLVPGEQLAVHKLPSELHLAAGEKHTNDELEL